MTKWLVLLGLLVKVIIGAPAYAEQNPPESVDPNDRLPPWSVMLYRGWTSTLTIWETFRFHYESANEDLYSAELAYRFAPDNLLSRAASYVWAKVEAAGNVTYRDQKGDGLGSITEVNAYLVLRWQNFPWNRFVPTSFAVGEGLSYAASIPQVEITDASSEDYDPKRLLNYLMFEATVAYPSFPRLQLVGRIHHRSGAFGAYGAGNAGSNTVGVGIRYYFDF